MAHEEENHPEEENAGSQSISEGVAAARAEIARRAEIRSGVTKPVAKKSENGIPGGQTLKMFLLKLVFGLVLIVLIGYFFLQALAGTINVGINSTNTDLNGKEVSVALYNGDVAGLLTTAILRTIPNQPRCTSALLVSEPPSIYTISAAIPLWQLWLTKRMVLHRATPMWLLLGVWIWVPHCI